MSSYLNFRLTTFNGKVHCIKCKRTIRAETNCVLITSGKDYHDFEHIYCLRCYRFPINAIEQNIRNFKRSINGKKIKEEIKNLNISKYEFLNK